MNFAKTLFLPPPFGKTVSGELKKNLRDTLYNRS